MVRRTPSAGGGMSASVKSLESQHGVLLEIQSARAPLASRGRLRPGGLPPSRRGRHGHGLMQVRDTTLLRRGLRTALFTVIASFAAQVLWAGGRSVAFDIPAGDFS